MSIATRGYPNFQPLPDIIETGRRNSAKFQYFFRQEVDLCRRLSERPSQLGSRLLGCYWLLGYNAHCFGSGKIDKNKWTGNPKIDSTSFSVLPTPLDERGEHRVIQPRPVSIPIPSNSAGGASVTCYTVYDCTRFRSGMTRLFAAIALSNFPISASPLFGHSLPI